MIYRGLKLQPEEEKRSRKRDWLKAAGVVSGVLLAIAALVFVIQQMGIS